MKRILFALAILAPMLVMGASTYPRDSNVCWVNPSLYEDGSDIQNGDLASIRVVGTRHDGVEAFDQLTSADNTPGSAQCAIFSGVIPKPGTYTLVAYAITIDDTSSAASDSVSKKYTGTPRRITDLANN